jgi:hypothetical protein
MRDSGGKYWCLPCGKTDQQKQAGATGAVCAVCNDIFPTSQLSKVGGSMYCAKCLKARDKSHKSQGSGISGLFDLSRYLPSSGGEGDAAATRKKVIILVVLAVLIVGVNYWLHRS